MSSTRKLQRPHEMSFREAYLGLCACRATTAPTPWTCRTRTSDRLSLLPLSTTQTYLYNFDFNVVYYHCACNPHIRVPASQSCKSRITTGQLGRPRSLQGRRPVAKRIPGGRRPQTKRRARKPRPRKNKRKNTKLAFKKKLYSAA